MDEKLFVVPPPFTPREDEVMRLMIEESAEVIQAVSKMQRFGMVGDNPERYGGTNSERLCKEIGDFLAMVDRLLDTPSFGITEKMIVNAVEAKKQKLKLYSLHCG